jgi:hypothetical protein
VGHGSGKGADGLPPKIPDPPDAVIFLSRHELERVDIIGPRHEHAIQPLGDDLEAVHGQVIIAPLECRDEAVPGGLHQLRPDPILFAIASVMSSSKPTSFEGSRGSGNT